MIPKVIHYCWFGRNPLPDEAQKCIGSWRKYLPDYEIKEWNEDNFDVNICQYTREAYEAKKYAFVSDYARFWIIYHCGGIYFDTDVEVIKPLYDVIAKGAFAGIEKSSYVFKDENDRWYGINPGLGFGAMKGCPILKEVLDLYDKLDFKNQTDTVVRHTTDVFLKHGYVYKNELQFVEDFTIFPSEWFCPMDSLTGYLKLTPNTRTIHHFTCSWLSKGARRRHAIKLALLKIVHLFNPPKI